MDDFYVILGLYIVFGAILQAVLHVHEELRRGIVGYKSQNGLALWMYYSRGVKSLTFFGGLSMFAAMFFAFSINGVWGFSNIGALFGGAMLAGSFVRAVDPPNYGNIQNLIFFTSPVSMGLFFYFLAHLA